MALCRILWSIEICSEFKFKSSLILQMVFPATHCRSGLSPQNGMFTYYNCTFPCLEGRGCWSCLFVPQLMGSFIISIICLQIKLTDTHQCFFSTLNKHAMSFHLYSCKARRLCFRSCKIIFEGGNVAHSEWQISYSKGTKRQPHFEYLTWNKCEISISQISHTNVNIV